MVIAVTNIVSAEMVMTEPGIKADYTIRLDIEHQKLFVKTKLTSIQFEKFLIGFPNSFIWSQYDGADLADRISNLTVEPDKVKLTYESSDDLFKLFSIEADAQDEVILSFTFNTAKIPYDIHFTELSPTSLHIPGLDFLVRVFESSQDIQSVSSGLDQFKGFSFTFENLPADWEVISTYSQPSDHSIVIDDLWGAEILMSAGKYKKIQINSGDSTILIAIDRGLKIDMDEYSRGVEDILQHFYSIYKHIPESKILMVVNQDPRNFRGLHKSFGGQVKKQNIINSIGWGSGYDSKSLKPRILGHLAHEGHHIWYSHGFQMKESWYWCQEGFTEYVSEKTIYKLGISTFEHFKKELGQRYYKYNRLSIKNTKNLVQTSLAKKPTKEEIDINYHKGVLVAYLLDMELQDHGKNLEQFLGDLYQKLAIPGKEIGNHEIITFIDEYLKDDTFTQKYILGTDSIPLSSFEFGWKYYWWITERYLPPLLFPMNLLVALAVIMIASLIAFFVFHWIRKWAKS